MKKKYYSLVAGLPDIYFQDTKVSLELNEFRQELSEWLTSADYAYIHAYFTKYDNANLLAYLKDEEAPLNELGNLSRDDLDDIILMVKDDEETKDDRIPNHFRKFIPAYENEEPLFPNVSWENQLSWLYFNEMLSIDNTFIRNWFEFDLNVTNLLTALNCRKYDLEVGEHILGDNEIARTIRQSNAKDFGISQLFDYYEDVTTIVEETNIYLREQRLDMLKWKYLDDNTFFHYFTIEKLFAFVVKFEILYRWVKLNKEKGEQLFRDMLNKLKSSYTLPEDFILKR